MRGQHTNNIHVQMQRCSMDMVKWFIVICLLLASIAMIVLGVLMLNNINGLAQNIVLAIITGAFVSVAVSGIILTCVDIDEIR